MCGICGMVSLDGRSRVDPATMRRMTDVMTHRGPDGSGYHCEARAGLGIRRLGIIDLESGDQPISSEDGQVRVVCNGEIYNYAELRAELTARGHRFRTKSDAEVIVHLFEEHGAECLRRLRGMFGLAVWDARNGLLLLARDRLGIKPLHYAIDGGMLHFASEQKAILAAMGDAGGLDLQAMRDLFLHGFVIGPRTLFSGIRRLQPGHYLICRDGEVTIRRYWDVSFPSGPRAPGMDPGAWAEALLEKLRETVRLHMRSDVPVGAWLSGGVDSSGIVGLMLPHAERPVPTFGIAFEDPAFDEIRRTRTLADFPGFGITNSLIVCGSRDFLLLPKAVWHCEDITTSGLEIPRMILARLTAGSVKVALTGEGADEIFGGYGWFHADKYLRPLAALPVSVRRLMLLGPLIPSLRPAASRIHLAPRAMGIERYRCMTGPPYPELLGQILSDEALAALGGGEGSDAAPVPPEDFRKWHAFNQLQYYEMKLRLPDFVNRTLDATSMAYSVEARVPFLDHELVEMCAHIPPALKMRGLNEKYILRRALREVLPPEIAGRKKRGLAAPFRQWLTGKLPEFAEELLSERRIREKGYFSAKGVATLMGLHRQGKRDVGKHLMGVLVVQLWDEVFLRNKRETAV